MLKHHIHGDRPKLLFQITDIEDNKLIRHFDIGLMIEKTRKDAFGIALETGGQRLCPLDIAENRMEVRHGRERGGSQIAKIRTRMNIPDTICLTDSLIQHRVFFRGKRTQHEMEQSDEVSDSIPEYPFTIIPFLGLRQIKRINMDA